MLKVKNLELKYINNKFNCISKPRYINNNEERYNVYLVTHIDQVIQIYQYGNTVRVSDPYYNPRYH